MNDEKVLVVGATGTVGSGIVKLLKEQGYQVRSTTSKVVNSSNKDTVQINLATGEGIKEAMEGITRAFFISPPAYSDQYLILAPLVQEAKRVGLKKVVLMTALGADADETSPFRRVEVELEQSGLNYNIVRPNWFLQNFNTFWIQGILEQGKILLPAGNAKTSFIDTRDISAVAAKLLVTNEHNNKAFNLTGPESLDHNEVASAISKKTQKAISYEEIKPEVFLQGLISAGLPESYASFLVVIMGYLKEGYNSAVTDDVRTILGADPRGLNNYVSDYKTSWL